MSLTMELLLQQLEASNIKLPALLKLLDDLGVNYIIAGGHPRDLFFGKESRDVDIFVDDLDRITNQLDMMGIDNHWFESYLSEDDVTPINRINGVTKLANDIDLIGMSEQATSPRDQVINYFDYNFNQFIMINESPTFIGDNFGTLTRTSNEPLTEQRAAHITGKALLEKWKCPD